VDFFASTGNAFECPFHRRMLKDFPEVFAYDVNESGNGKKLCFF
jgi:hypothetical protein